MKSEVIESMQGKPLKDGFVLPLQIMSQIKNYNAYIDEHTPLMLGYPFNLDISYLSEISHLADKFIANLGGYASGGTYSLNAFGFEQKVVDSCREFFGLSADFVGQVVEGGTFGNINSMLNARTKYPWGKMFYSDQTHYSGDKCADILGLANHNAVDFPLIKSQKSGEMDYGHLKDVLVQQKTKYEEELQAIKINIEQLDVLTKALLPISKTTNGTNVIQDQIVFNNNRKRELQAELADKESKPFVPIIIVNLGTTMTGAVEDSRKIIHLLAELEIEDFHLHGDGALGMMLLPFNDGEHISYWDEVKVHFDSLAVSTSKQIGTAVPGGLFYVNTVTHKGKVIPYIGSEDNCIGGSRIGILPVMTWLALNIEKDGLSGKARYEKMAADCYKLADWSIAEFNRRLELSGLSSKDERLVKAWRNPFSTTVVYPWHTGLSSELRKTYSIAAEPEKNRAHTIAMPHQEEGAYHKFFDRYFEELKALLGTHA